MNLMNLNKLNIFLFLRNNDPRSREPQKKDLCVI